jgi:UTP-glucose-1-phosphate uridylyltransferase
LENRTLILITKIQKSGMTKMFSYVISLLANLNARGQLNTKIQMNDKSTPVRSSAQQQTNKGRGPRTWLQASNTVAPGTSVTNAVKQGASIVEEA